MMKRSVIVKREDDVADETGIRTGIRRGQSEIGA
jgi:hypothetical protein